MTTQVILNYYYRGGVINEEYTPNKIGDYPNATFTKDIIIPENTLYEDITHNIGLHINDVESGLSSNIIVGKASIPTNYVTFTSTTDMTITPKHTNSGRLLYSTDKINWNNIASGGTTSSSKVIYMAGKMDSAALFTSTATYKNGWTFNNASNLSISGNLNTLLNYENPPTTILDYCYAYMFYNCTSLTDISNLKLPATGLGEYCYKHMFIYCSSLTIIPSGFLPAIKLMRGCYQHMFYGCSLITIIPSNLLQAITLQQSCYYYMFYDCTSLIVNNASSTGYTRIFRIPYSGTGTTATGALQSMFNNTAGTMNGTPTINTIYYIKD